MIDIGVKFSCNSTMPIKLYLYKSKKYYIKFSDYYVEIQVYIKRKT